MTTPLKAAEIHAINKRYVQRLLLEHLLYQHAKSGPARDPQSISTSVKHG